MASSHTWGPWGVTVCYYQLLDPRIPWTRIPIKVIVSYSLKFSHYPVPVIFSQASDVGRENTLFTSQTGKKLKRINSVRDQRIKNKIKDNTKNTFFSNNLWTHNSRIIILPWAKTMSVKKIYTFIKNHIILSCRLKLDRIKSIKR